MTSAVEGEHSSRRVVMKGNRCYSPPFSISTFLRMTVNQKVDLFPGTDK